MEPKNLPESIYGQRIVLKKHTLDLAGIMFSYINQDRKRLAQFLPWVEKTQSKDDSLTYINLTHKDWIEKSVFDYGIFSIANDEYMGNVGLHTIAWPHNRGEIGYWILGKFEGQGFISEAVSFLEKESFSIGFHRLEIRCSSHNARSASVPRRLGYHHDGTFVDHVIENGKYRDTLIFSKLSS